MDRRDHLFISYAGEDWVFAEWLARKLALNSYAVWFDGFKLLGGESYPRDIDLSIKTRTFRLIAILSHNSINKENPRKERTLAMNISRERNIDFLIPINLDGLKPTDLDWMTNDLTFISFHNNWHLGLIQLLKKLNSINAPQSLKDGQSLAANTYEAKSPLKNDGEKLISNIIPVLKYPKSIMKFRFNRRIANIEKDNITGYWPIRFKGNRDVYSFHEPPEELGLIRIVDSARYQSDSEKIDGIRTKDIISTLISNSIRNKFIRLGCKHSPDRKYLYIPMGTLNKDKIFFTNYNSKSTYVLVAGRRQLRRGDSNIFYYYHLCPRYRIRQDLGLPFALTLNSRLFMADKNGDPLPTRSALSRRKKVTKSWFNHQWLSRIFAIFAFLKEDRNNLTIVGPRNDGEIVFGNFLSSTIPVNIDEMESDLDDDNIAFSTEEVDVEDDVE